MWFVIHLLNGMHPQDVEKKPFLPRQELKQRWQARDPAGMWRFFFAGKPSSWEHSSIFWGL
jgi:hypothetical protein